MSGGSQNFTEVGQCRKSLRNSIYASFPAQPRWLIFSQVLSNEVQYFRLPIQLSKRLSKGSKQAVACEPRSGSDRVTKFLCK